MRTFQKQFFESSKTTRLVGASCVAVTKGRIVENLVFGYQDLESKKKTAKNTIYRIASISKMVVALAAMKLIEEEKLGLYDDLQDIFGFPIRNPWYPNEPITVAMLMTQTSSIADGYDDEVQENNAIKRGYNGVNGTNLQVTLRDLLEPEATQFWTSKTFINAKPGSTFEYSNFGCGILACIIEKISNRLFTEYVRTEILKPLGIDGGFRPSDIQNRDAVASLYYPDKSTDGYQLARNMESFLKNEYTIFPIGENYRGPAGGLFISMIDLAKLMQVFMNDGIYKDMRIVEKKTMDLMLQQHWNGSEPYGPYRAKGLQMKIYDHFEDQLLKGHTGNAYGVKSLLFFNKEQNIGICYITNGGYYKCNPSHLYDCQEEVLQSFLECYWPRKKKLHQFSFRIADGFGFIDKRKIVFPRLPIIEDDIYMPAISIGEGLLIIPKYTDDEIVLKKNQQVVVFNRNKDIKDYQGIAMLPIKKVLSGLGLRYDLNDELFIVDFHS